MKKIPHLRSRSRARSIVLFESCPRAAFGLLLILVATLPESHVADTAVTVRASDGEADGEAYGPSVGAR